VVWFPPGEKHWHGGEAIYGKVVEWMEKVIERAVP